MRTIQRDIVGAFIFSSDNQLLLGRGGVYAGNLVIPGGGIDEGETPLDALRREVQEETGLDIADAQVEEIALELTGASEKTLRDTGERVYVEMTFYNFKVTLDKPAAEIGLHTEDDFTDPVWVPIAKVGGVPLSPPTVTSLQAMGYLQET